MTQANEGRIAEASSLRKARWVGARGASGEMILPGSRVRSSAGCSGKVHRFPRPARISHKWGGDGVLVVCRGDGR